MNNPHALRKLSKWMMALAVLAAFTILPAMPRAHAETEEQCKDRIVKANVKLHDAIDHHGPNSSQADHARHDLQDARERCWKEHHKWWDEDQHRWHDQQDWDQPPNH
jgi:hypothetical protein